MVGLLVFLFLLSFVGSAYVWLCDEVAIRWESWWRYGDKRVVKGIGWLVVIWMELMCLVRLACEL